MIINFIEKCEIEKYRRGRIHSSGIRCAFRVAIITVFGFSSPSGTIHLEKIVLPEGFRISLYASNIPDARSMALSPDGILVVGTRKNGTVWSLSDTNGDGRSDLSTIIAKGLTNPNGVAFLGNDLYVAERSRILRYKKFKSGKNRTGSPEIVRSDFPDDREHGWKYIAFGPDEYLYVPVGVPCNVCLRSDPRYGSIMRMKPDGSDIGMFARGIRNTVGFDWHPVTKTLWFTDNGRDNMGDNLPPDELNHAPDSGMHFGFPFCHGNGISDPRYGTEASCDSFTPPVMDLGPHVAALGMKFYTGKKFPPYYHNQIFIAEHGSWNRSAKSGYRVTTVRTGKGRSPIYEVFAEGWMRDETAWGRPVDLLVMPDGSLLVSDDMAGAIYRIQYFERGSGGIR